MKRRLYNLPFFLLIKAAVVLIVLLHVLHPFIHFLEGGSLDMILMYLEVWAYNAVGFLPTTDNE